MTMTPEQRSMRSQIAAYARWSVASDATAATAPARRGFFAKFEDEVDPNRELPEEERTRRARAAQKRHMTALAFASSRKRSARKAKAAA